MPKENIGEWFVEAVVEVPAEIVFKAIFSIDSKTPISCDVDGLPSMRSMWRCGRAVLEVLHNGNREVLKFRTWYRKNPKDIATRRDFVPAKDREV